MSKTSQSVARHRRWILPAAAGIVVTTGVGYGALQAGASSGLEPKSADQILVGMHDAEVQPLAGTVVASADLGLPDLPGAADSPELASLVSGSHTLRVWYGGAEQMRIAKLGGAGETSVIRNGSDAWIWSSTQRKAVHYPVPEHDKSAAHPKPTSSAMPATPQEAADEVLTRFGENSTITTTSNSTVAGRDAYELVLTPKQTNTLVKDVRLAVDGETMMPLRVQVYSTKLTNPAYEIGFTSLELSTVEDRMFAFTPPAGTAVEEAQKPDHDIKDTTGAEDTKGAKGGDAKRTPHADAKKPTVVGQGWERVYVAQLPNGALQKAAAQDEQEDSPRRGPHSRGSDVDVAGMLAALPQKSGPWGSGRVLDGTLFSVVLTDDDKVALGAVDSARLTDALQQTR